MDLAEFTAEAEGLARRARLLTVTGSGEPAAYWHGLGATPCVSLRHGRRWLNVQLDGVAGHVEVADAPALSPEPLFAQEVKSLPPVDAVFSLGSSSIEAFLRRHGWNRSDPFNSNFPDDVPGRYERLWRESCPLYSNEAVAVSGGWHFPWPDGDFHDFIGAELVVWTLREAEPWIEVFEKDDRFVVKQRVT